VAAKNSLRLNIFSGKEKTYQAWNGIDENTLKTNRTYNSAGAETSGNLTPMKQIIIPRLITSFFTIINLIQIGKPMLLCF
jgi:hypothetical protein